MAKSGAGFMVLAALDGLMGVAAGAFGAHAAHDPHAGELLRTGAQYQIAHALAALLVGCLPRPAPLAGWLFGSGALVFGGSLYLLAATGARALGAVTPLGGVLMIAGWGVLAVSLTAAPRR